MSRRWWQWHTCSQDVVQVNRLTATEVPNPSHRRGDTVRPSPKGMMEQEIRETRTQNVSQASAASIRNSRTVPGCVTSRGWNYPATKVNFLPPFLHEEHNNHLHRQYQCFWWSAICITPHFGQSMHLDFLVRAQLRGSVPRSTISDFSGWYSRMWQWHLLTLTLMEWPVYPIYSRRAVAHSPVWLELRSYTTQMKEVACHLLYET
jgi:hypothetical protein